MTPNFYKQTDSRWSSKRYRTTDGGHPSVGGAGCGPTAIANIVSATTHPSIKPYHIMKYACKKGYMTGNSGMYWSAVPKILKHYGLDTVDTVSHTVEGKKKLKEYLGKGYCAVAIMHHGDWTRGGHYIGPYYIDDGVVHISDPASYSNYRQRAGYDRFWSQSDCSWCVVNTQKYKGRKEPKATKRVLMYVSDNYANVRKGRGTGYKKVGKLDFNTAVKLESYKSGWYKIIKGKYKGYYICAHTLSKYKQNKCKYKLMATMNVRNGYSSKTTIIGQVAKGKTVTSTKQRGRWAYVPSVKGWICIKADSETYLKAQKPKVSKTISMYVSGDYANVRKGRGTAYTAVGKLDFNTKVKLTSYKDNWYKIANGKYKGYYICAHTLSKYKQCKCKYKTLCTMNVRSGYSTKTDVIGSVAKGKIITSTKQRGRWAYIPAKKGWVCIKSDTETYLKVVKP